MNDDFWTRLASAPFSDEAITSAIDTHLSGKAHGEAFEGVRALTDKMRAAGALSLPVEAGTKVLFAGNLGAYLSYDEFPTEGSVGEVVTVKSANGDITHHDGKVFVKWDDGKFLGIHAEHLRLAGQDKQAEHKRAGSLDAILKEMDLPEMRRDTSDPHNVRWLLRNMAVKNKNHPKYEDALKALKALVRRKASDLKKQFERVKALAEKKPDNKFLKDLLEQMADEGFAPTDKQMKVVKDIEGEVEQQAEMKEELKGLKGKKAALPGGHIDAEILHRAHAAGRKARSMPMTYGNMDMAAATYLERGNVPRRLWGDAEVAFINGWMGRNHRRASFRFRKANGIGDLREFLGNRFGKTADGKLIHKSTNDLWSITADGDNYTVSRLFDDEGHPLKG
jgi:hypothetical protein